MKILVTGRGGAGSWTIRGEQIGNAMGAKVKPKATLEDMRAADVILVVKKLTDDMLANLRASGKPWVYDIVDAYPQPECSTWQRKETVAWLHRKIAELAPSRVVWPNRAMRDDAGGHGVVIYHHARPGFRSAAINPAIRTIGYEGAPHYLEGWMSAIGVECERFKAAFLVNPTHLSVCDVVLALRGGKWRGYAQTQYKSNVKLANAHANGVPFIGLPEMGYIETATGKEIFVNEPEDLRGAFDALVDQQVRQSVQTEFLKATRTVEQAATEMLCALKF